MSESPNQITERTRASATTLGTREVHITLTDNRKADFTFSGFWTGHDIRSVMSALSRAYHKHKAHSRRTPDEPLDSTE